DGIHDRGGFCGCRLQGNRQRNGMDREELARRIFRTEAPGPLLARLGLLRAPGAVLSYTERFQPWRAAMIRGKGRPLPEMRAEPRKREFACSRIKCNGRTFQRSRRLIVR